MSTLDTAYSWHLPLVTDAFSLRGFVVGSSIALLILYFLPRNKDFVSQGLPGHVLIEGYAISQLLLGGQWLNKLANTFLRTGLLPAYGFSSKHHVLVSPGLAANVLKRPHHLLHNEAGKWALSVRVFGSQDVSRPKTDVIIDELFAAVSRNLLQEANTRTLLQNTYEYLRKSMPSLTDTTAPWTVNAQMELKSDGSAEVDMYELVRDFVTHASVYMLAGADFLKEYPDISTDLFALDNAFALLALGVPAWMPLPIVRKGVSARSRIIGQAAALSERIDAVATGTASEELQARLQDVNGVFWDRAAAYRSQNLSMTERGASELGLFWAMNANTSPFVFWVLAYLYSTPSLLEQVRAELDPLIGVTHTKTESATTATARVVVTSLDADGLVYRSPLLKATSLETLRIATEPTSVRRAQQDLFIPDPTLPPGTAPLHLRKGTFVSVPRIVQHFAPTLYPEPYEFRPERFLSEKNGEVVADYGVLKPWGDGASICKGRTFAEREVLVAVALVARVWDIEPVGEVAWKLPGKIPGTGVVKPAARMRVRVRLRGALR